MDSSQQPLPARRDPRNERIRDLEHALQDAIEYLRRLPPVPVTVEKAVQLEAVLQGEPAFCERAWSQTVYAPNGIPLLSAEFFAGLLHVKCPATSDEDARLADLIGFLRKGTLLRCQQKAREASYSDLELAHWEVNPLRDPKRSGR